MDFRTKVEQLVHEFLETRKDLYLVDLKISAGDDVTVILDGDVSLSLQDCLDASRAIEFNLDREEHDFSLEVASVGVGSPLKLIRQYKKNVGRTLIVKTANETIEAELVDANDEKIVLSWTAREPKKIGKGKETVQKTQEIPYSEIKEAVVTVNFN